jgi:hypothetical protein
MCVFGVFSTDLVGFQYVITSMVQALYVMRVYMREHTYIRPHELSSRLEPSQQESMDLDLHRKLFLPVRGCP